MVGCCSNQAEANKNTGQNVRLKLANGTAFKREIENIIIILAWALNFPMPNFASAPPPRISCRRVVDVVHLDTVGRDHWRCASGCNLG